MSADLNQPNRKDPVVTGDFMSPQFAEFIEAVAERLNYFQIGDGDPTGTLVTKRKMIYLRQDGGLGSTLYVNELGDGTANGWRAI